VDLSHSSQGEDHSRDEDSLQVREESTLNADIPGPCGTFPATPSTEYPSDTSMIPPHTTTPAPEALSAVNTVAPPAHDAGHSETEVQFDTDLRDQGTMEKDSAPVASSAAPQWKIAAFKKRSGQAKARKKARKQAKADRLNEVAKLVRAVADGGMPSMELVISSYRSGWIYRNAEAMSLMSEKRRTRTSAIVVEERAKQPTTHPSKIHSMLPLERVNSCETLVATFHNRWTSDHDDTIAAEDLSVKVDGYVVDMEMLKATKMRYVVAPKIQEVHKTLTWIGKLNWDEYMDLGEDWTDVCLDRGELVRRLRELDVMTDGFFLTTFRDEKWIESSALDLAISGLVERWKDKQAVFTCPSWLFKFPNSEVELIKAHGVWKQLELAAADFGFMEGLREDGIEVLETRENLWFFAVVHYGEHWCGIAVNYKEHSITIFDPMKTKDRFQALRSFLYEHLIPLLPKISKRWCFKQLDMDPQMDTVNCGPFVLLFFDIQLSGCRVNGGDAVTTRKVMQFMHYRYLSLGLSALKET
jgi:hypothetical protein